MNRRLYFVLPDVDVASQLEKELLLERIEDKRMHFLGKRGTDLGDLPEANVLQKTDIVHGMEVGLFAGATVGALFGLVLYFNPDLIGADISLGLVFIMAVVGGGFGAWASGMIGSSTPNSRIKKFQKTMDDGHILLILDVPKDRVEKVREIIGRHHPEIQDHGLDPTYPPFP